MSAWTSTGTALLFIPRSLPCPQRKDQILIVVTNISISTENQESRSVYGEGLHSIQWVDAFPAFYCVGLLYVFQGRHCNTVPRKATHFNTLQRTATSFSTLQYRSLLSRVCVQGGERCLIFVDHFSHKSPIISGSFAKRDLQHTASYASWPPCTRILHYPGVLGVYVCVKYYEQSHTHFALYWCLSRCVNLCIEKRDINETDIFKFI